MLLSLLVLNHILVLQVGADMRAWFATMPRPQRLLPQKRPAAALGLGGRSSAGTIDAYYLSRHCAVRVCSLVVMHLPGKRIVRMKVPIQTCTGLAQHLLQTQLV